MLKTLITGGNGFLGAEILRELTGFDITTLGRSSKSAIVCDISKNVPNFSEFDLVIHCAGKAHSVPKTESQKQEFFDVNVKGTVNLLKGLEKSPSLPKSFIFISTVAVYGKESGIDINETSALKAADPYGLSKIEAERIVQNWCLKHNVLCGILRLPLLVGLNPPGNLGALIKGIKTGYYFNIGGGTAKKSMVLAADVAKVLPRLAEIGGVYNLTDGHHPSFFDLSQHVSSQLNKKQPLNIPLWLGKVISIVGNFFTKFPINSNKLMKITSDLTFDDSKARKYLGWKPNSVLTNFSVK